MKAESEIKPFYARALGCLLGGLIGDAMGTPTEGKDYREIESSLGWVDDFSGDGTDDTVMKHLLIRALVQTDGYATLDDWARVWLQDWEAIFGPKVGKFYISVLHTAHKLRRHASPRMAALGNMPSSSSAMCIAPVGIVNACNPQQAALQAYNLAGLIHIHDVGFCQDGAAAIAAAVATAFSPDASVSSILTAAQAAILPLSGAEMLARIASVLALAAECGEYRAFREQLYAQSERFFCRITCDSRETIPLTLAVFQLAQGDVSRCVTYAANLGRDADTIATMAGAVAGAYGGVQSMPEAWVAKALRMAAVDPRELARELTAVALTKLDRQRAAQQALESLLS
ncbi:MAG: ADP-ribosylglycohydrolase family protein [Anaerolineae bacterium]|nr:ADP-ribosylglycohydrolase family protein [Anaerolineae bacterium]